MGADTVLAKPLLEPGTRMHSALEEQTDPLVRLLSHLTDTFSLPIDCHVVGQLFHGHAVTRARRESCGLFVCRRRA